VGPLVIRPRITSVALLLAPPDVHERGHFFLRSVTMAHPCLHHDVPQ
jgi:hypothetical protein